VEGGGEDNCFLILYLLLHLPDSSLVELAPENKCEWYDIHHFLIEGSRYAIPSLRNTIYEGEVQIRLPTLHMPVVMRPGTSSMKLNAITNYSSIMVERT
jgi:hypothetical protein